MRQLTRRIFFAIGMFLIASRQVNADESERMLPIDHSVAEVTHYRSTTVDGVKIFYREAGPSDGPVVLLLHGFPTSSYMFRRLIPALAARYHVIAPDYPGFGAIGLASLTITLLLWRSLLGISRGELRAMTQ